MLCFLEATVSATSPPPLPAAILLLRDWYGPSLLCATTLQLCAARTSCPQAKPPPPSRGPCCCCSPLCRVHLQTFRYPTHGFAAPSSDASREVSGPIHARLSRPPSPPHHALLHSGDSHLCAAFLHIMSGPLLSRVYTILLLGPPTLALLRHPMRAISKTCPAILYHLRRAFPPQRTLCSDTLFLVSSLLLPPPPPLPPLSAALHFRLRHCDTSGRRQTQAMPCP
jgi:hypothetical protein